MSGFEKKRDLHLLNQSLFVWLGLFYVCLTTAGVGEFFGAPLVVGVVFYFGLFRGTLGGNFWAFCLGFFSDLILGTPPGLQAFLFTALFFALTLNRKLLLRFSFKLIWAVFASSMAVFYVLEALFFLLKTGFVPPLTALFLSFVFLVLTYPFTAAFCGFLDERTASG